MANPLPATAARIEARVSLEAKALIQKAVDIEGGTLTDFTAVCKDMGDILDIEPNL